MMFYAELCGTQEVLAYIFQLVAEARSSRTPDSLVTIRRSVRCPSERRWMGATGQWQKPCRERSGRLLSTPWRKSEHDLGNRRSVARTGRSHAICPSPALPEVHQPVNAHAMQISASHRRYESPPTSRAPFAIPVSRSSPNDFHRWLFRR